MNQVRKQVVEVTDLFTLESWDFTASTETTDEEAGTTVDEETNGLSLLTIPSLDDFDFSKENNTDQGSSNVHVSVSGMLFAVDAHIFKRLEALPWQLASKEGNKVAASYRPIHAHNNNCHAFFSLETSPVLFEMLLNFLMFGTLPDLHLLDLCDVEELEPLAALLNLDELQHHLEKKIHRGTYRMRRLRNLDSFNEKHKKKEKSSINGNTINKVATTTTTTTTNNYSDKGAISGSTLFQKPTGVSFSYFQPKYKCSSNSTGSTTSTTSTSSSQDATTALPFPFRRMHAALENRRLTQQTRKKMTHADHCAMSDELF